MSDKCMQHIESAWKEKTNAANEHFNQGNYEEALIRYEEALFRAEVFNNHQSDATRLKIPFMQVFAISCNNIAFTYEEMGEIEKGNKMLERVIYYFLYLSKENKADNSVIDRDLKRAYLTYNEFASKHGLKPHDHQKVLDNILE